MNQPITVLVGAPADSAYFAEPADTVELVARTVTGNATISRTLAHMPDTLVVDVSIADTDAREVCRQLHDLAPATRALAVSEADGEELYTTVAAGAFAAIVVGPGTDGSGRIAAAATRMANGESVLSAHCARRLLGDVDAWAAQSADPLLPPPSLTATERRVLERLGSGSTPAQIAASHHVTSHLVNIHTGYAVAKLHRYLGELDVIHSLSPR